MARGRMLNQKIAEDEDFNAMSIEAQFMFMRAIPFLDRDGLITGHPILLQSKIVPLLPEFAPKMPAIIAEWIDAGLVIGYSAGKTAVLFFEGFSKNNTIHYTRESASSFPPPPGYYRNGNGLEPISDNQTPDQGQAGNGGDIPPIPPDSSPTQDEYTQCPDEVRTSSGLNPDEVRLEVEVKREVKTTLPSARETEQKSGGGDGGLRQTDPAFAEICTSIENNGFGMMTQILSDEVVDLLKDYPLPWILDAMTVAVNANKRTMRYVNGVLRRWRAEGRDPPVVPVAQGPPAKVDYAIAGML